MLRAVERTGFKFRTIRQPLMIGGCLERSNTQVGATVQGPQLSLGHASGRSGFVSYEPNAAL